VRFLDSVWRKSESRFLIRAETGRFFARLDTKTDERARETARDRSQDPSLALHSKVLTVADVAIPDYLAMSHLRTPRTCSMKNCQFQKSKAPQPTERLACFGGREKP